MVGASVDKPGSNERWAQKYDLRMPLISDYGEHTVAAAFGVARPMVGVAKRTTWLIDPDGTLRVEARATRRDRRRRWARGDPDG